MLLNWRFAWRSLSGVNPSGSLALLGPLELYFPCVYCVAALLLEALPLGIVAERHISYGSSALYFGYIDIRYGFGMGIEGLILGRAGGLGCLRSFLLYVAKRTVCHNLLFCSPHFLRPDPMKFASSRCTVMLIIGYVTYIYLDNMEKFLVERPQLIPTAR